MNIYTNLCIGRILSEKKAVNKSAFDVRVSHSMKMAVSSLQSTLRLVTGYEIPVVGYGVRHPSPSSKSLQDTQSDLMNPGISDVRE